MAAGKGKSKTESYRKDDSTTHKSDKLRVTSDYLLKYSFPYF